MRGNLLRESSPTQIPTHISINDSPIDNEIHGFPIFGSHRIGGAYSLSRISLIRSECINNHGFECTSIIWNFRQFFQGAKCYIDSFDFGWSITSILESNFSRPSIGLYWLSWKLSSGDMDSIQKNVWACGGISCISTFLGSTSGNSRNILRSSKSAPLKDGNSSQDSSEHRQDKCIESNGVVRCPIPKGF